MINNIPWEQGKIAKLSHHFRPPNKLPPGYHLSPINWWKPDSVKKPSVTQPSGEVVGKETHSAARSHVHQCSSLGISCHLPQVPMHLSQIWPPCAQSAPVQLTCDNMMCTYVRLFSFCRVLKNVFYINLLIECICGEAHMPQHGCRGQRITCGVCSLLPT